VIAFRHVDPRFPFLWEDPRQPPARWHDAGEGPVQYLADTPDGAWAEFLRHEEIATPEDVATIRRALWAIEVPEEPAGVPELPAGVATGGPETYPACRAEARRLRDRGARRLTAVSAALRPGAAHGWRVDGLVRDAAPRDGRVIVLFGPRPDLVGWPATVAGRPGDDLLARVSHFALHRAARQLGS
jgi:hypothetical protein